MAKPRDRLVYPCSQTVQAQGSMFTVELPAIVASHMGTSSESSPVSPVQPNQIRLLVVEDHRDTTRMLYLLLAGLGYAVKTAGDAATALELVSQESFDMLISDIGLPDETGYELMKQIRQRHPIKGIAVTAYGTEEDVRKSRDAGFSEHLLKPVELSQLHEAIQRVLARG